MVDTFPFRPTDVETHMTTFGIILCTGRNCLGCNPEIVGFQGGIEGFEVDQIDFEKNEKQEEDSETKTKTWIMNPVTLTERQLGAGDIARENRIWDQDSKNVVETNSRPASAMNYHSTAKNENFDAGTTFSNESLHRQYLGKHKPESELNNNDLYMPIGRPPRHSDSQEKMIQRDKERLTRYSDSQEEMIQRDRDRLPRQFDSREKIIQRDKERLARYSDSREKMIQRDRDRLPRHLDSREEMIQRGGDRLPRQSDSREKIVQRETETSTFEVLNSEIDIVNRSAPMVKSSTVHCLKFRRNITSLDLKITDIGYALEDQLGTTVNVLDIEKRSGDWRLWVKGENTRNELLRDGLLAGFHLHRLEEVEVASEVAKSSHG
eukprot:Seg609.5 transcript_id=Seg609.5/GoldUCD/mRNA.D3Y31 product="hypothetical protein" protein_id=Seg609.5/GoldUCD/D3Y31